MASCADCLEIWEPEPPGTLRAYPVPYYKCVVIANKKPVTGTAQEQKKKYVN
jgi:hypothetical protein